MRRHGLLIMLSVIMIGALIFTGCKKSVGTPEDNATKEEAEESIEEEQETFFIGFSAIDMGNPYFITLTPCQRSCIRVCIHFPVNLIIVFIFRIFHARKCKRADIPYTGFHLIRRARLLLPRAVKQKGALLPFRHSHRKIHLFFHYCHAQW